MISENDSNTQGHLHPNSSQSPSSSLEKVTGGVLLTEPLQSQLLESFYEYALERINKWEEEGTFGDQRLNSKELIVALSNTSSVIPTFKQLTRIITNCQWGLFVKHLCELCLGPLFLVREPNSPHLRMQMALVFRGFESAKRDDE